MPFKSPVMNEPLPWIVVIQNLVGVVLFPRERKKVLSNNKTKQGGMIAAHAAGSLSRMRWHNPVPMTTHKRAGN